MSMKGVDYMEDIKRLNANLPSEVYEMLRRQARSRYTTITQYIIDLIVKEEQNNGK